MVLELSWCEDFCRFAREVLDCKSNRDRGNQDSSENQKNIIQGQRPDMKNRQRNSNVPKNWEHTPGAPVG